MEQKPLVVQFGAGAIGRGFLGDLWTQGGREVLFFDVSPALIALLNRQGSYPLRLTGASTEDRVVSPVRAALVTDVAQVMSGLAACEFACTAVGVHAFPHLAPTLASGIVARIQQGQETVEPLNILCCENQKGAGEILRAAVASHLPDDETTQAYFERQVAFVDASVGRMVPPPTPELLAEDLLLILAEPYAQLPIDGNAWIGPVPPIPGLLPKANFAGYVARKLFAHNGGHAVLAYEGYQRGYEYIWQAAEDLALVAELKGFWAEVGAALVQGYGFAPEEQKAHDDDLLQRFRNQALGDTIRRVGRDVARKVRPDDRLVGAALFCESLNRESVYICRAIAAAYAFDAPDDPTAPLIQQTIRDNGIRDALGKFSHLAANSPITDRIAAEYATIVAARP
jgi:mannitol-1-phosphate 5-dehydrogenase